ncbi:unnamed protein product [Cyclocybe aegerita]|uniref:Uncharacterized protein n=1 Tax=Cyclocybe aegerita TaxID=1973307 RepID=A0A8S0XLK9_CYCAE|nr:unnamed protein product [Cyclocybe aegerita]
MAKAAYDEALMLWELVGYYPSSPTTSLSGTSKLTTQKANIVDEDLSDDESEVEEESDTPPSDRQQLQEALDVATVAQEQELPSYKTDELLDQCGYAAAVLNFADLEAINNLPDDDPNALAEI